MTEQTKMTYAGAGVDYGSMDPFKRDAQHAGLSTAQNLMSFGFTEEEWTRGESAYVVETPWGYLALVVEGLGTKSLVADAMYELANGIQRLTGISCFGHVAQCNVAMAVNDLITVGARPVIYGQYLAVGESRWFDDPQRSHDLVNGTRQACNLAGCVWGGGETPTLQGIIMPGTVDLAGATVGIVSHKNNLIRPRRIGSGDAIILVASSGIHANGLTMARKIAEKLPAGYLTLLPDGRTYGESLLDPTEIYVPVITTCQDNGIDLHYVVNVTGHGWRKLMRAEQPFTYVIDTLPRCHPIFRFMQEHGPIDDREAYGNFNMGAGLALYVHRGQASTALDLINHSGFTAHLAGYIEQGPKRVVIRPLGLDYSGDTLGVR
jgi:phosphoribosylformylglycinamidine cyclo-ligase